MEKLFDCRFGIQQDRTDFEQLHAVTIEGRMEFLLFMI